MGQRLYLRLFRNCPDAGRVCRDAAQELKHPPGFGDRMVTSAPALPCPRAVPSGVAAPGALRLLLG